MCVYLLIVFLKVLIKYHFFVAFHDLGLVNPSVNVAEIYHPSKSTSSSFLASLCKLILIFIDIGTAVAQWLRHCATNRKVAGSIPAGVSGFFIDIKSF